MEAPARPRALFETLHFAGAAVPWLDDHLARLMRGARELGLAWPEEDPRVVIEAARRAAALDAGLCRLELGSAGFRAVARPLVPFPAAGVRLWSSNVRAAPGAFAHLKAVERDVYERAAAEGRAHGAEEALLWDAGGVLREGAVTNVFLRVGDELLTPALADGCVAGVARARLLRFVAAAPVRVDGRALGVREGGVRPGGVWAADEVLLTNAGRGVIPVRSLAGPGRPPRDLPGPDGPLARVLLATRDLRPAAVSSSPSRS